jgi:hypothetical protein
LEVFAREVQQRSGILRIEQALAPISDATLDRILTRAEREGGERCGQDFVPVPVKIVAAAASLLAVSAEEGLERDAGITVRGHKFPHRRRSTGQSSNAQPRTLSFNVDVCGLNVAIYQFDV